MVEHAGRARREDADREAGERCCAQRDGVPQRASPEADLEDRPAGRRQGHDPAVLRAEGEARRDAAEQRPRMPLTRDQHAACDQREHDEDVLQDVHRDVVRLRRLDRHDREERRGEQACATRLDAPRERPDEHDRRDSGDGRDAARDHHRAEEIAHRMHDGSERVRDAHRHAGEVAEQRRVDERPLAELRRVEAEERVERDAPVHDLVEDRLRPPGSAPSPRRGCESAARPRREGSRPRQAGRARASCAGALRARSSWPRAPPRRRRGGRSAPWPAARAERCRRPQAPAAS